MNENSKQDLKIHESEGKRPVNIESLIIRLGVQALAEKFKVSESTVHKWRRGIHKPSRKTLSRLWKELF